MKMNTIIQKNISISVIVVATIFISALYSFYYHDHPRVDSGGYDRIGLNLARGLGYVEEATNASHPRDDFAINRVGPGYEFFLAGVYGFFGHHIWVVWIFHAVFRGISVILLFLLARILFPEKERIGLLAAGLFGLSPDLVVVNGLLLTETIFLMMLIGAVYTSALVYLKKSSALVLCTGCLWTFAILIRPTALVPWLFMAIIFLWQKNYKTFLLFCLPTLLLIGSWSIYATKRYDRFILTTGVGGYDLWVGNNAQAEGGFIKSDEVQYARDTNNFKELDKISKEKYLEFLTQHPISFAELQIRKTALYFSLARPGGYWIHLRARPWHLRATLILSLVWTSILFILGLAGASLLWSKRHDIPARLFLLFALFQPLTVIPIIVETRYRYPFFPFLAVLVAYFITEWKSSKKKIVPVVVFIGMCSVYDIFSNFADITMKLRHIF